MFTGIDSSDDSRQRARAAAVACGVKLVELELSEVFAALRFVLECEYFTGRVREVDGGLRL